MSEISASPLLYIGFLPVATFPIGKAVVRSRRSAVALDADIRGWDQKDTMSASKAGGIAVFIVVVCIWAYIALTGEPRLPIGVANGSYSNRCCGTLVVANGVMTIAGRRVSYVIEQDKVGPYILPETYVGASNHGFVFRSAGYPLKLRLDNPAHPRQVELLDDSSGGEAYSFASQKGS